jgi:D-glycero-alpha-D-manno-heptose-7-phosphate kinase
MHKPILNEMVRSRAPLRLGLAGGGTDVSPFCDQYGGAVLNATIHRYAYVTLRQLADGEPIIFHEADGEGQSQHPVSSELPLTGSHRLHMAAYNYAIANFNHGAAVSVEVYSHVEAPRGSGLGSSSTLVVALLKAYALLFDVHLSDYELAHAAFVVERLHAGMPGGHQDQYAAAFGGCNYMEFGAEDRVRVSRLKVESWILAELEAMILLVHTGKSRDSGDIILQQSHNVRHGDTVAIDAMLRLREDAVVMRELLAKGDFSMLFQRMLSSWSAKKAMAHSICTPSIDCIYQSALDAGALCGKISGAGGGGVILFIVDPNNHDMVKRAIHKANSDAIVLDCHFTSEGSQAWHLNWRGATSRSRS